MLGAFTRYMRKTFIKYVCMRTNKRVSVTTRPFLVPIKMLPRRNSVKYTDFNNGGSQYEGFVSAGEPTTQHAHRRCRGIPACPGL